jgi:hypothetical protein
MRAKCKKEFSEFPGQYTIGRVYSIKNNNMNEEHPIWVTTDRDLHHTMSKEYFAEHFEVIIPPAMSDIIFKMGEDASEPEDFESIAFLINSVIEEFGGFACYTAEDIKSEFNRRL